MSDDSQLTQSLAALSQFFVGDKTMVETLERVSAMTCEALPAAEFVGITMMSDGQLATTVFTDPEAPAIDRAQYETGEGPCIQSFRTGDALRIDSTADETRWPEFCAACRDRGIRSTLAVPLEVDGVRHGALNLYSRRVAAFGAEQLATASLFAAQAAIVLANASTYWAARVRAEEIEQALAARAEIEQATGILMSTMRCTADEAYEALVDESARENLPVTAVARDLIARTVRRPTTRPRRRASEAR